MGYGGLRLHRPVSTDFLRMSTDKLSLTSLDLSSLLGSVLHSEASEAGGVTDALHPGL